ncbi:CU044_5270 family protein [Actinomadura litoris]|uniref:CU044_5270 family protein n=1 Tax=Actinomadura litoris TaxID=2678616 RepID=UPI001FA6F3C9|nr:CU044_5270 family protein [Actinomadura litoris]
MDELETIREAYGEPAPPTLRETTEARARVLGKRPPRRSGLGRRLKAGIGVAAAGAAVAVGITVTGSGSPAPPSRTSPAPSVDLGRQAVLAAASRAAAQPGGEYWYSDSVGGQSYLVRSKTGAYAIVGAHTEFYSWAGARPGMGEGSYGRDIPSRPLTKEDAELWKKDGSPSRFRVWSNDHYDDYGLDASKWEMDPPSPKGGGRWRGMTAEQLQDLPTDPEGLTRELFSAQARLKRMDPHLPAVGRRNLEKRLRERPVDPVYTFVVAGELLRDAPIPPGVRAGLMRVLTALPGVTAIGTATDALGRTGPALARTMETTTITAEDGAPAAERGDYDSRQELVFDQRTGRLIASQNVLTRPGGPYKDRRPGFVINYEAVRDAGWTDAKPAPPARLPF